MTCAVGRLIVRMSKNNAVRLTSQGISSRDYNGDKKALAQFVGST